MRKKYILNAKQNSSSIILVGKGGIRVRYDFKNGSVVTNLPAAFITSNLYYQTLLEESDYFKKGIVKLTNTFGAKPDSKVSQEEMKVVTVKDAKAAIEWVADTFGMKVTSGRAATEFAKKHGYVLKTE